MGKFLNLTAVLLGQKAWRWFQGLGVLNSEGLFLNAPASGSFLSSLYQMLQWGGSKGESRGCTNRLGSLLAPNSEIPDGTQRSTCVSNMTSNEPQKNIRPSPPPWGERNVTLVSWGAGHDGLYPVTKYRCLTHPKLQTRNKPFSLVFPSALCFYYYIALFSFLLLYSMVSTYQHVKNSCFRKDSQPVCDSRKSSTLGTCKVFLCRNTHWIN